ncbi:MAG: ABC-F family ATP-binding cassette domain-containing protein [Fimbriimonadaceae bacterium]|nr:ABC-F family ATP-binding cassette domain-containing protein [Fimbriimonadaceae bacterium]
MPLLEVRGVSRLFGVDVVLDQVDLLIERGERIGLVGANGSGKTTLCRLILGWDEPDGGTVTTSSGTRIGYLAQDPRLAPERTILDEATESCADLRALIHDFALASEAIAEAADDPVAMDRCLARQAELLAELEARDGFDYEQRLLATLGALGFGPADLDRPVQQLSGGEKSRLALAKLLMTGCDLLLLDEPTNHLDIRMTEWLEEFLKQFAGGVIVVSHDRWFLDNVCQRIAELEDGHLTLYTFGEGDAKLPPPDDPELASGAGSGHYGAYTHFTRVKAERREAEWRAYASQQKELKRQEAWIRWKLNLRRHSHVVAARSRQKMIDKLDKVDRPADALPVVLLNIEPLHRGPNDIAEFRELGFGYTAEPLFEGLTMQVRRLQRIGIIGPNGCGKSTLLKLLLGELQPTTGRVRVGESCEVGYYHQEHRDLDLGSTPVEEIRKVAPDLALPQIRGYLARFLFFGDEVFRPVDTFSGGERSRLVLAKLILGRPNVLLLDEPTNHLDIPSREVLEEALRQFQGTILVVSHDRYFLDQTCQRLLVFADGEVAHHEGSYSDLAARREAHRRERDEAEARAKKDRYRAHLDREKEARRAKQARLRATGGRDVGQLETAIEAAEAQLAGLHEQFAQPDFYADGQRVRQAQQAEAQLRGEIAALYEQYQYLLEGG